MSDFVTLLKGLEPSYCYYVYAVSPQGEADYIHYGYYETGKESLREAQERLSKEMMSLLPDGIKTALDSGCGLGRTSFDLANRGYQVTGISPHTKTIEFCRTKYKHEMLQFEVSRFEDFRPSTKMDLVLFQESSQYIDILKLIQNARDFISDNGYLLICDEVNYGTKKWNQYHQKLELLHLAKIHGFTLLYNRNITKQVLPTRSVLCDTLAREKNTIVDFFSGRSGVSEEVSLLHDSWARETQGFIDGAYGYEIFLFQKSNHVLDCTPEDNLIYKRYKNKALRQKLKRVLKGK